MRARVAKRHVLIPGCAEKRGSAGEPRLLFCLFVCLFPAGSPVARPGDPPWPTDGRAIVASDSPKFLILSFAYGGFGFLVFSVF